MVTTPCIHHGRPPLAGRNRKCNLIHNHGCASGTLSPFLLLILPQGPCPLYRKREIYNLADGKGSMGNSIIGKKVVMMGFRVEGRGAWPLTGQRAFLPPHTVNKTESHPGKVPRWPLSSSWVSQRLNVSRSKVLLCADPSGEVVGCQQFGIVTAELL